MDSSSEQIIALADKLSILARDLASCTTSRSKQLTTQSLVGQAKQLITEIQDPFEAIMDQTSQGYTIASTLSLLDIGIFDAIPAGGTATVKELADRCNAEEELIIRLMRPLTCNRIFKEIRFGEWAHNRLSLVLKTGGVAKGFYYVCFDEMLPAMLDFHRYMRQFGRRDITTYTETPHSWYNQMLGKNFWDILDSSPERVERFNKCLTMFSSAHPVVAMFPFEEALTEGNNMERPILVDMGGGRGQAVLELRKGLPNLKGTMILQDRPSVIDSIGAEDLPGVVRMAHDFFTEQPVKDAQVYYIRRVMHDWQDEDAAKIMKAIIPAMAADSRILISDMMIPEPARPEDAHAVWLDVMLMGIGGLERTRRHWQRLADLTGLQLVKIWQEREKYGPLCVVEYMLNETNVKPQAESKVNGVTAVAGTEHDVSSEPDHRTDGDGVAQIEDMKEQKSVAKVSGITAGVEHYPVNDGSEERTKEAAVTVGRSVEVGG